MAMTQLASHVQATYSYPEQRAFQRALRFVMQPIRYLKNLGELLKALNYVKITTLSTGYVEVQHTTGSRIAFFPDGTLMTEAATDNWQRCGEAFLTNCSPEFKALPLEEKQRVATENAQREIEEALKERYGCLPTY